MPQQSHLQLPHSHPTLTNAQLHYHMMQNAPSGHLVPPATNKQMPEFLTTISPNKQSGSAPGANKYNNNYYNNNNNSRQHPIQLPPRFEKNQKLAQTNVSSFVGSALSQVGEQKPSGNKLAGTTGASNQTALAQAAMHANHSASINSSQTFVNQAQQQQQQQPQHQNQQQQQQQHQQQQFANYQHSQTNMYINYFVFLNFLFNINY